MPLHRRTALVVVETNPLGFLLSSVFFTKYSYKLVRNKSIVELMEELMEYQNGYVTIHPRYIKLITAIRTAVENGEGSLDKEATSHYDLFGIDMRDSCYS